MATVVNDLVTKFSFDGSTSPLVDYNSALGGSIKLLAGFTTAAVASASAFGVWATGILTGVDSLDALSNQTGVAVGRIQELNYAAEQTQSSSAAVESTIRSLADTIGQASIKGNEDFSRLGISVRDMNGHVKSADTVLKEVSSRFRQLNLSLPEQQAFASSLGIDSSLLQLMNKTSSEMAELTMRARELGVLTEEQTEQAADYRASLNALEFGMSSIKQLIAVGVAPEFRRLTDGFTDLIAENKDWIVNVASGIVEWTGKIFDAVVRLSPVIGGVAAAFGLWALATKGLTKALALSPIGLVTIGIVGLLAAVDDLIVAFQGGESAIANFFKDNFDIDVVDEMTKAIEFMSDAVDLAVRGFKQWWEIIKNIHSMVTGGITTAIESIAGFFSDDNEATINQNIIPIGAGIGSNTSVVDNRKVEQNNRFEIRSNDPEAVGRAVGDTLQRQLDSANTQLAPGGL
mgnify:CR=1 FL=1